MLGNLILLTAYVSSGHGGVGGGVEGSIGVTSHPVQLFRSRTDIL